MGVANKTGVLRSEGGANFFFGITDLDMEDLDV